MSKNGPELPGCLPYIQATRQLQVNHRGNQQETQPFTILILQKK